VWRDEKAKKIAQMMEDLQREEQKALEKEVLDSISVRIVIYYHSAPP
jgi:hypothetical protein